MPQVGKPSDPSPYPSLVGQERGSGFLHNAHLVDDGFPFGVGYAFEGFGKAGRSDSGPTRDIGGSSVGP